MSVHFIGAGPGDPDLITVKGRALIERCEVCLYAGSLVPEAVVAMAPGKVMDTAPMTLEETHREIVAAHRDGQEVAVKVQFIPEVRVSGAETSRSIMAGLRISTSSADSVVTW